MENRASKLLEMYSQRHRFLKISRGSPPPPGPPPMSGGGGGFQPLSNSPPAHGLRRSFQAFGLKCPPPPS